MEGGVSENMNALLLGGGVLSIFPAPAAARAFPLCPRQLRRHSPLPFSRKQPRRNRRRRSAALPCYVQHFRRRCCCDSPNRNSGTRTAGKIKKKSPESDSSLQSDPRTLHHTPI